MKRRTLLISTVVAGALLGTTAMAQDLPPLEQKDRYKVGFAQMESNNPWRIAETKSFHDTAEACGWDLIATDAAGSAAKQVADVDSMIAQGIDVLFLPPREEKPLIPAVMKARAAGIPTFLVDRSVDPAVAKPGEHFVAFLGSDFIDQGNRAAQWLMENFDGDNGVIVQLEGTTGSSPANDRKKGFDDAIAADDRFEIVASQTGDFARDLKGLLDHFGVEKAHLCGLSMGGRIAQDFYLLFPERVKTLTLVATFSGFRNFSSEERQRFINLRKKPLVEDGKEPRDIAPVVAKTLIGPTAADDKFQRLVQSMEKLHKDSYVKTIEG